MDWRNRASCTSLPTDLFFPGTSERTDKQYWETHLVCRECPVNVECLQNALTMDYEYGVFAVPERVRRRFKAKPPRDLDKTLKETYTTIDIIAAEFNGKGMLVRKRCLRCNRTTKGYPNDAENWGSKSHICVSCHIQIQNNKQVTRS